MAITDKELIRKVEEAIDQLRPYLEADGGDMSLYEIDDNYIAQIELHGACMKCSMSHMTLKAGLEEAVKKVAPEIKGVVAVGDDVSC